MKIQTKILEDFINKIQMGTIETCLLNFTETGLVIKNASSDAACMCEGLLKASAFEDYTALGEVGVDNLTTLKKVLKRLGKELVFEIEGNSLSAKGNKKELSFELVSAQFIETPKEFPKLLHPTSFKILSAKLQEFFKDISESSIKDAVVTLTSVENGVKLSNTGKYKFTYNVDSEGTKGGEKVSFGQPILNALKAFTDGELVCSLKSDYPMAVVYASEHVKISVLIAPRVNKGE
jgi:hypothetical protein